MHTFGFVLEQAAQFETVHEDAAVFTGFVVVEVVDAVTSAPVARGELLVLLLDGAISLDTRGIDSRAGALEDDELEAPEAMTTEHATATSIAAISRCVTFIFEEGVRGGVSESEPAWEKRRKGRCARVRVRVGAGGARRVFTYGGFTSDGRTHTQTGTS